VGSIDFGQSLVVDSNLQRLVSNVLSRWRTPPATSAATDFTSDGIADVLARDSTGQLRLFRGNGSGGFVQNGGPVIESGWNAFNWIGAAGDFFADGHPDILARDNQGNLHLCSGTGAGTFVQNGCPIIEANWGTFNAIIPVGDFTGDGQPDVLARDGNGRLRLFTGNGAGGFDQNGGPIIESNWAGFDLIIGAGKFNADSFPDVIARDSTGRLRLFSGNGAGGFVQDGGPIIESNWAGFNALVGGSDFNGDGKPDVVARDSGGQLRLFNGTGSGGFVQNGGVVIESGWGSFTALVGLIK
jgi:hypothetical protein